MVGTNFGTFVRTRRFVSTSEQTAALVPSPPVSSGRSVLDVARHCVTEYHTLQHWELKRCSCAGEMPFSGAHLDTPILAGREQSLPRSATSVSDEIAEMDTGGSFVGQSTPRTHSSTHTNPI